ncbi:hypothetical protein J5N97_006720 [Dioscorea zingiberensis]|uniref:Uncharacterized protein n=1 Tax=Dioscorea zingiberensis TaxID=325984 RepID=A0A9D5DB95_9LILI|nr:hypothetical protein J5N97_006720 [Dioscorea zingiberensis]
MNEAREKSSRKGEESRSQTCCSLCNDGHIHGNKLELICAGYEPLDASIRLLVGSSNASKEEQMTDSEDEIGVLKEGFYIVLPNSVIHKWMQINGL